MEASPRILRKSPAFTANRGPPKKREKSQAASKKKKTGANRQLKKWTLKKKPSQEKS